MGSSATEIVGAGRGTTVLSPSVTLDAIAQQFSLSRVSFIKCDVEGAELHIFNSDFLRTFRPKIIIEPHIVKGVLCHEAVSSRLRALDYSTECIHQTGVALPLVCATPMVRTAKPREQRPVSLISRISLPGTTLFRKQPRRVSQRSWIRRRMSCTRSPDYCGP